MELSACETLPQQGHADRQGKKAWLAVYFLNLGELQAKSSVGITRRVQRDCPDGESHPLLENARVVYHICRE